jgi:hypothetical protein
VAATALGERKRHVTEYELFFAWSETTVHLWSMIQFWAGLSFGLIIAAHVAARRLNLVLVAGALLLYTSITLFIGSLIAADGTLLLAVYTDAARLVENNAAASDTIIALARYQDSDASMAFFFGLALLGTYLATVGYFIYSYVRRESTVSQENN